MSAPGGAPVFLPGAAVGAIPNGARILKVVREEGDAHAQGARGTVLASHGPLEGEYGYFVEWDDTPDVPVFVRGRKIAALEELEQHWAGRISQYLDVPLSRIVKFETFDPGQELDGRTGVNVIADPPFTDEERARLDRFFHVVSAQFGGRPPIKAGSA